MRATGVLALCLMAACYATPQPDCGFVCGTGGECPADYQCGSDQRCHRDGTPASLRCAPDAPPDAPAFDSPGPDAPGPDADVTAPTVMSTTPANAASGVSRTTTITVNFDEAVMNVDTTSFAVAIGGNGVAGTLMQTAQTYVFTPSSMLMPNATVTVALSAAITDLAGNPLMQVSFSFGTGT